MLQIFVTPDRHHLVVRGSEATIDTGAKDLGLPADKIKHLVYEGPSADVLVSLFPFHLSPVGGDKDNVRELIARIAKDLYRAGLEAGRAEVRDKEESRI